jgi:cell division protein FtsL
MATWATAATRPETAIDPRPRAQPRRRPARHARSRPRVVGVVWIAALTILLAGVVATNVAVLRLNMTLDRLGRDRAELRATNSELNSRISSNAAAPRIEAMAARKLGLVQATQDQTSYVRITP